MDYYERKKKTLSIIDGMIEKNNFTRDDIQLAVLKNTFIGKKFVDDYINSCILRGLVIVDKNTFLLSFKEVDDASSSLPVESKEEAE